MPYVGSGGLRLFYTESGDGLPVLWHTGGCGDSTMWERAGYIAGLRGYAVAAAHPERLAGLVGLDSVPDPAEQSADLRNSAGEVMAQGTRAIIEQMVATESEQSPAWLLDHLCTTEPAAFAGAYEAFATAPPFWPGIGQMTVPTLLLLGVGDEDQDWWALGQAAAAAMPDAQAVALKGLRHLQAFWRTDLSLPPIERFLAGLSVTAQT
jgi:pimeloyl-ACP methyl ester carboxylesterase